MRRLRRLPAKEMPAAAQWLMTTRNSTDPLDPLVGVSAQWALEPLFCFRARNRQGSEGSDGGRTARSSSHSSARGRSAGSGSRRPFELRARRNPKRIRQWRKRHKRKSAEPLNLRNVRASRCFSSKHPPSAAAPSILFRRRGRWILSGSSSRVANLEARSVGSPRCEPARQRAMPGGRRRSVLLFMPPAELCRVGSFSPDFWLTSV